MNQNDDYNKRMAYEILLLLEASTALNLSISDLEKQISTVKVALDKTFPESCREIIDIVLDKIENQRQLQYCATLNTENEGSYDESISLDNMFSKEIDILKQYLANTN
jgi:hypothetical protein